MTGQQFELYVSQVFYDNGHHTQMTKSTGDFGVDLILNGYIAVQVKCYSSPVGAKAVQEAHTGMAYHKCTEAWVVTNNRFTPAAKKLAEVNRVRLIEGDELKHLADNPDSSTDRRDRYQDALAARKKSKSFARKTARDARKAKARAKMSREQNAHVAAELVLPAPITAPDSTLRAFQGDQVEARRAFNLARFRADEARREAAFRANFQPNESGWYPDPANPSKQQAYWDGEAWSAPGQGGPELEPKPLRNNSGLLVWLTLLVVVAGVGSALYWFLA
jgi:hypothetical protein